MQRSTLTCEMALAERSYISTETYGVNLPWVSISIAFQFLFDTHDSFPELLRFGFTVFNAQMPAAS
ncbi:MAG: hypothetical protein U0930_11980 [Pirellulales bacterium]